MISSYSWNFASASMKSGGALKLNDASINSLMRLRALKIYIHARGFHTQVAFTLQTFSLDFLSDLALI